MRIIHFARFSPNQAGIYGTTRDLILAERAAGIAADLVDFGSKINGEYKSRVGLRDSGIVTQPPNIAKDADILVRHSAVPPDIVKLNKPTVLTLHGAPEYTVRLDHAKKTNVLRDAVRSAKEAAAVVTFWKEHVFEWETMFGVKVEYCPAVVDLDKWNPEGPAFDFGPGIHIVSTGMWRNEYRTPYECIMAAAEVVKEQSDVHLHIFGCPTDDRPEAPYRRLMHQLMHTSRNGRAELHEKTLLSSVHSLVSNLPEIYRGADLALTPHVVASRTVRESLACGCPIVAGSGNSYTAFTANPDNRESFKHAIKQIIVNVRENMGQRGCARIIAEREFNPALAGKRMKEIFEGILNG